MHAANRKIRDKNKLIPDVRIKTININALTSPIRGRK